MNFNITRRQFLQYCTASAAALGLSQLDLLKLEKALAVPQTGCSGDGQTPNVIYLGGQNCTGCQTSLLNRVVDCGGDYYDADLLNALYGLGLTQPTGGADPVGLELSVVNDVADLLVGDAVRALTGVSRSLPWADDLGGVGPFLPSPNPFPNGFITLQGLSTVSAGAGDLIVTAIKNASSGPFVLLLDGSIPGSTGTNPKTGESQPGGPIHTEKFCLVFDNVDHTGAPLIPWLPTGANVTISDALRYLFNTGNCLACVCVGSCSSYGGIPGARGNRTGAKGLWTVGVSAPHPYSWLAYNQNLMYGVDSNRYIWTLPPVINVPGCPPHPDWIVYPVAHLLIHGTPPALTPWSKRPKVIYDDYGAFCDNCPNTFTQGKAPVPGDPETPAYTLGDSGCLGVAHGCKGSKVYGDCPVRMKNTMDDGTKPNWCVGADRGNPANIGNARHPCQGCIEPGFPDEMSKKSFYASVF